VLTCSALKRSYRKIISSGVGGEDDLGSGINSSSCVFVMLEGTKELIEERMRGREHFMPPGLLQSQFDALELPTPQEGNSLIVVKDITAPVLEIVEYIVVELEKI
jgi:carbohydrate kinase (thermoresistant glucokinase family)